MQAEVKRKRKALLMIWLILLVSLFLFGSIANAADVRQITMGAAGSKGSWYMLGSTFAKIISANVPNVRLTCVVSPGASTENCRRIHAREMEMGLSNSAVAYLAHHGLDIFSPTKHDVLAWFRTREMGFVIAVRAKSNIKSIEDLKGKKISLDRKSAATYFQTVDILGLHGLEKKDYKEYNQSRGEGSKALIDGRVDCWFYSTAPRSTPHITKMMAARKIRFISIDRNKIRPFLEKHPYYDLKDWVEVQGQKQEKPVTWIRFCSHTMAGNYVDEKLMYDCTKAFFENIDQLHAVSPKYKVMNLDNALSGIIIPVHPGAMRYYKEKGVEGCENPALQYRP